jgi:diamine N-acetyltransferase
VPPLGRAGQSRAPLSCAAQGRPASRVASARTLGRTTNTMAVTLREITSETVRAVTKLSVAENQKGFVAPNAVSLAEALFSDEAWYRAIYDDGELVGFVMLSDESIKKEPPAEPNIGLWRLMIDQRYQRRGIGRQVMRLVLEYVRSRPGTRYFYTSYVPDPGGPGPFYLGLGFEPNGEVEDGEVVVIYPLHTGAA